MLPKIDTSNNISYYDDPEVVPEHLEAQYLVDLRMKIVVECLFKNVDYSNTDPLQSDIYKNLTWRLDRVEDEAEELINEYNPDIHRDGAYFQFLKTNWLEVAEEINTFAISQKTPKLPVKGHLYKIEDTEGTIRGYLLGTIHMMHSSIMDMNEEIKLAISKADHLFVEIKEDLELEYERQNNLLLKTQSEKSLQKGLQNYINILRFHPLKNTTWKDLKKEIALLKTIDAIQLCYKHYKYIFGNATGSLDSSNYMIDSVDGWVKRQFVKAEKTIFGLESLESISKLTDELFFSDVESQEHNAMCFLEPYIKGQVDGILKISRWSQGDIKHVLIPPNQEGTIRYKQCEGRSEKFGEVIYQDIKLNKVGFYAFGAAHLYDSKGVIKSLESRNLKIIRI